MSKFINRIKDIIKVLKLDKHPEGGYYYQNYKSDEIIEKEHLPKRFPSERAFSTSIYFLLMENDISAFHKINQDEIWHHYEGDSVLIHVIQPDGQYYYKNLGKDFHNNETPQVVVKKGCYFAAEIINKTYSYALMGCTVAPGFEFEDFQMPKKEILLKMYPQHSTIIERMGY